MKICYILLFQEVTVIINWFLITTPKIKIIPSWIKREFRLHRLKIKYEYQLVYSIHLSELMILQMLKKLTKMYFNFKSFNH